MSLPATRATGSVGRPRSVEVVTMPGGRQAAPTERLLAFGALTVSVVEDLDVGGYPPERLTVTLGGRPLKTMACGMDVPTGRRWIETEVGLVVVPSASDRTKGACLTVNGMAIPGA